MAYLKLNEKDGKWEEVDIDGATAMVYGVCKAEMTVADFEKSKIDEGVIKAALQHLQGLPLGELLSIFLTASDSVASRVNKFMVTVELNRRELDFRGMGK